jgi:hypothetical protein
MSIVSCKNFLIGTALLAWHCSLPAVAQPPGDSGSLQKNVFAETNQDDATERPLILPPKKRPEAAPRSPQYWVGQLSHDQYLRRELATKQLIETGAEAIPAIVEVLKTGDLETVERAMSVICEIALAQPPDEDGGAWGVLNQLAARASGIRSSRAEAAIGEVRESRGKQARAALMADGIFVGLDDFIVRSASAPRMTVEIDGTWQGDLATLQWLRWLDGVECARIKGTAVRREVLEWLVQAPDLHTVAIIDASVDQSTLEPLQSMSRIASLEFRYVKLTPEICDLITALPIRLSINLMGTGVANEKVDQMRAALPGLAIDHKQGGFLGVVCIDSDRACQIERIVSGGAAEAAGLIPLDVIVGIGESEVRRFKDLQAAINQHLPGDEVEVRYLRGSQVRTVSLHLRRLDDK